MEWILRHVNTLGEFFVGFALPLLVESAALIGLVLSVEFLLRTRVRARLRYGLVAFVLAYLMLTPLLSLNPPSTHWPAGKAAYAARPSSLTSDPTLPSPASHTSAPLSQLITGQSQTTVAGVGERPRTLTWQGAALVFWLAGVAAMSGILIRRAMVACKGIDRSPAANLLMNEILTYCRRRMGVRSSVRLKISQDGTRPVVCGLLRPVIVVPRNLALTLGSRHLRDVLFHELAHLKQRDLWMNLIRNCVRVLYFYNPLLLAVNAVLQRLQDEAANEAVLDTIGDVDHSYSRRLAEVATLGLRDPAPSLCVIAVA